MLSSKTENFEAKLVDFGLAEKLKGHQTGQQSYVQGAGTKGYAAPEIIAGAPFGSASDIWSLGCLLHAMLTVTLPYHHSDTETEGDQNGDEEEHKLSEQVSQAKLRQKNLDLRCVNQATQGDEVCADLLI